MYTTTNLVQALMYTISLVGFVFLGYKFYKYKESGMKLFGAGLFAMGIVQFCALGVTLLWQFLLVDFKSLEYLVYILAILFFFAASAFALRPKTRKLFLVFILIISIMAIGLYIINPTLSGPAVYQARYVLSFDNPTTINVFGMMVALAFGLATLISTQKIQNKLVRQSCEAGFLVVIVGLVLNILSYSDTTKLLAGIAVDLALLFLSFVFIKERHNNKLKSK